MLGLVGCIRGIRPRQHQVPMRNAFQYLACNFYSALLVAPERLISRSWQRSLKERPFFRRSLSINWRRLPSARALNTLSPSVAMHQICNLMIACQCEKYLNFQDVVEIESLETVQDIDHGRLIVGIGDENIEACSRHLVTMLPS
jgi:hypothetical protein